jgi:hypothetical protein
MRFLTCNQSNRPSKIVYVGSDMHHFATLQKWADGSSSAGPLKVLEEKASVPVEER